jgi:cation-transporting P-type ATPase I
MTTGGREGSQHAVSRCSPSRRARRWAPARPARPSPGPATYPTRNRRLRRPGWRDRAVNPLSGLARAVRPGRHHRRVWREGRLAHIEVRGVDRPGTDDLAALVEAALNAQPGVASTRVVPAIGRVVVLLADGEDTSAPTTDELVEVVAAAEQDNGVADEPFPVDRPDLPGDHEPWVREVAALVGDGLGVGVAVTGRIARLAKLPVEVAAILPFATSQPWLRRRLEAAVGPGPADTGLALAGAAVAAAAQGPLGPVVDAAYRALALRGLAAGAHVWRDRSEELSLTTVGDDRPHVLPDRSAPAATGPAETYAGRAAPLSGAAGAATFLATGQLRRATSMMLAGLPKAAREGVEAYAACLQRELADEGIVCLDSASLRRLDAVDTVVVEGGVVAAEDRLVPGARELADAAHAADHMLAVAGGDPDLAADMGADLVVEGGDRLVESILTLKEDGCGVLLVARTPSPALRLADCSIGLLDDRGRPPWAAHVIATERGLADALLLVEAAAVAHAVSRQSRALSMGGSAVGALIGATAPQPAPGRTLTAVNVAALAAIANGVRAAGGLAGQRPVVRDEDPAWHELEVDEVLDLLDTGRDGLDAEEAARRRAQLPISGDHRLSLAQAFGEELANPLTPVLAVGAGLSAAVGSPSDAGIVGGVMALNALIGAGQRVRVDRAIGELEQAVADPDVRVRRAGEVTRVPADELVPGDVVVLTHGDSVPADCRLVRADNLEVDESSLTGESLPVAKSTEPTDAGAVADRSSMLYEGTAVAAGEAEAVVVATGPETEAGRASTGASVISRGVEERLEELSRLALPLAAAGGLFVTGTGLTRRQPLRQTLSPGVNLAVAAVPEGLPLLATVAQLSAARRLAARGALARNPQAIETLGRVDVLCVDKTGTLTGGAIELGVVTDGAGTYPLDDPGARGSRIVAAGVRATPEAQDGEELAHVTDQAVVNGATEADVAGDDAVASWTRQAELPFEPRRGYHAVLGRTAEGHLLSVKGAPEVMLPRCDTWAHPDGDRPLGDDERRELEAAVEDLARRGHRVLAVAEREASDRRDLDDDRVQRLTLLGFLGLVDPVRPAATEEVARIQAAGLRVVMVTGDHPSTAEGIAQELGLTEGDGTVLTGVELDDLDDEKLDAQLDDVRVFARVTPSHKVRIVEAYRRRGHTVAMTGDGANDAPAIRLADVGVALGENATAAARAAADLVVPDGRIETIVAAIVEGRALWGSVRDALAILLGGNLGEIGFTVAGTVAGGRPPLSARQLMLVNLLTDVAPGLAIAVRAHRDLSPEDMLREGPDASLGAALQRAILVRATATAAGAGLAWTAARLTGRERRASTVALAGLVGSQLGQTLMSGGRDPIVALAAVGSALVLAGIVQTPGVSQFFGCTPIGPLGWAIAGGSSIGATVGGTVAGAALGIGR